MKAKIKAATKKQIPSTVSAIWIQPMMMPATARPSPLAVGGVAFVSLRAMYPVIRATMPPMIGMAENPMMPAITLTMASVLVGGTAILYGSGYGFCSFMINSPG